MRVPQTSNRKAFRSREREKSGHKGGERHEAQVPILIKIVPETDGDVAALSAVAACVPANPRREGCVGVADTGGELPAIHGGFDSPPTCGQHPARP